MSGYRSLHRVNVLKCPIWHVVTSPLLTSKPSRVPAWRVWIASGDGLVRSYLIHEKDLQKDVLDASACSCYLTHELLGPNQSADSDAETVLGCTQVRLTRNYVGDDDRAGDLLVVSLELSGIVRVWSLPETMDDESLSSSEAAKPQQLQSRHEFKVEDVTGTMLQLCPPRICGIGDVVMALACLDGTVAVVSTGIATPKATREPEKPGTVVERWSKIGSIALCGDWHPSQKTLAVGRQDGQVEMLGGKPHRLIHHEAPVRAVSFTPDGHILVSGSDDGMLCAWDISRVIPTLVHHVVQAHNSWVLSITMLQDSRRFISCGADRRLHVWSLGQMDQAVHSFSSDDTVWSIHATNTKPLPNSSQHPRLVSGSEEGGLRIYSTET